MSLSLYLGVSFPLLSMPVSVSHRRVGMNSIAGAQPMVTHMRRQLDITVPCYVHWSTSASRVSSLLLTLLVVVRLLFVVIYLLSVILIIGILGFH